MFQYVNKSINCSKTYFRDSYIGVHDLTTNTTTTHFEGKVEGLESFAFDWITRNLFWADLYKQWIMVGY